MISGNTTLTYGGGIHCYWNSRPDIIGCTISNNTAERTGGGIYCESGSSPLITDCRIISNTTSSSGGGIACDESSPVIRNCTLRENSMVGDNCWGGGIYCHDDSSPSIGNCIIVQNSATGTSCKGGGLSCSYFSCPEVTNCTIARNSATGASCRGGGVYSYNNSSPVIKNCTIADNDFSSFRDGIYCYNSSAILTNCIVWGTENKQIWAENSSLSISYSDIKEGWAGVGNISADPLFFLPEQENYHLEPDSPCIDTGTDCGVAEDIDGDYRPLGAGYDMGSDEVRCDGPLIFVSPNSFLSIGVFGAYAEDDTLTIRSVGSETLEYAVIQGNEPWLSVEGELEGIVPPGDSASVILKYHILSLDLGVYRDTITVLSNDPWTPSTKIPVRLDVCSAGTIRVPGDCSTIQAAIDLALEGATVLVADGTYTGYGNKNLDFTGKSITVRSENGAASTVIDCEDDGRGFYFDNDEDEEAKVEGFTITTGNPSDGLGGGICCRHSSPIIANCLITGNSASEDGGGICLSSPAYPIIYGCSITENVASDGGAIHCFGSLVSPTVVNCILNGNSASAYGGGVYCFSARAKILSCTISANTGNYSGGGIYCRYTSPTIRNSIITLNTTTFYGGGFYCTEYSSPTITNCSIIGNSASCGGGIYCYFDSSPTITSCILGVNTALEKGGGIYSNSSEPTIGNCTISGNTATRLGGAICFEFEGSPTVTNSILWNDSPEEIHVSSSSPVFTYCDIEGGWTGTGNIDEDPLFLDSENGDFHLFDTSPCIDAGNPESENVRWGGSRRDMGAFEFDKGWYLDEAGNRVKKNLDSGITTLLDDPPDCMEPGSAVGLMAAVKNNDISERSCDRLLFILESAIAADTFTISDSLVTLAPGAFVFYPFSYIVPPDFPHGRAVCRFQALLTGDLLHSATSLTRVSFRTHWATAVDYKKKFPSREPSLRSDRSRAPLLRGG